MPKKIEKFIICKKCNGNGFIYYNLDQNDKKNTVVKVSQRCTVCRGTGHTGSYLKGEDDDSIS